MFPWAQIAALTKSAQTKYASRSVNRRFPRSMRSQGKRPGRGSRQACRPRRHFRAFLFSKETLTGHYFIFKFDLSLGIRTNIHKLVRGNALSPAGFCGQHNVNNIRRGGPARHHVTTLDRYHETHYNIPLTSREPAQPKPFNLTFFSLLPFLYRVLLVRLRPSNDRNRRQNKRYGIHWRVDSFVSGLHDHFTRGGRYTTVPADIPRRLTVKRWVDQFHLIGQRGSCVLPMHELPYNLTDIRPDFAIVDNGGNDLASTHSPLSVADAVITIAHNILNVHHARHVTVCSALYRTKNTGSYSVTDYNHRVGRFNNILRHFCDTEQDITYHTHRGFWQCPLHVWSYDGTHPNTAHGRKLYIKSLRRATHYSVKHVTRK